MSKNLVSLFYEGVNDLFFGSKSVKDCRDVERETKELYPEILDYPNSAVVDIRKESILPKYIQPLLTFVGGGLLAGGYFNWGFTPNELVFGVSTLLLVKGEIYIFSRQDIFDRRKILKALKKDLVDEIDDEGEEWKHGIDYGFSEGD